MEDVLKYDETRKTVVGVTDKEVRFVVIPQGVTSIGENAFRRIMGIGLLSKDVIQLPFATIL